MNGFPESLVEAVKKFNNQKFGEGENLYDYENAIKAGLIPDKTGHWASRVPGGSKEGLILKHETHPTFWKTQESEEEAEYQIYRGPDNRLYSFPKEKVVPTYMVPNQTEGGGS